MTEEMKGKLYRAVARLDLFIQKFSAAIMYLGASLLMAIAAYLEWDQHRSTAIVLGAIGAVGAVCGAAELRRIKDGK